ncbi:MAG: tripartite tricarboxylate transporter substrate binding protein [Delftia acidovorans]|nr:MAG: tripartite tricarboxylate transporter substrate binding protein [Delftia acidovorans]
MPTHANKPVSLVVSFPAGGAPDQIARLLAPELQARWKTPVVVVNRVGASGVLGNDFVARAEADGHTLLVTPNTFTMVPHVLPADGQQHADVVKDYTPIALLSSASMLMLASPLLGAKTAGDVAKMAKARPDLSYATSGHGTPMHIVGEMFNKAARVRLHHVPYKGTTPAINDVLGGHVMLTFLGTPTAKPLIDAGRLVPLAVADKTRSPLLPDLPTMQEQGFADVEIDISFGVYGPRNMAPSLADAINKTLREVLAKPEVTAQFRNLHQIVEDMPRSAFAEKTRVDYERYGKLVKELGITVN